MNRKKNERRIRKKPMHLQTPFYAERSTKNKAALDLILNNHVRISYKANCSHRSLIEQIAAGADRPFSIDFLSQELDRIKESRSGTVLGWVNSRLDQIAGGYPNMRWWMTDNGLRMAIVQPESELPNLSEFDAFAGMLMQEHFRNKRLSKESLLVIATALDEKQFLLKDWLQPGYWKAIATHNESRALKAIKTFDQAVRNPNFVRGVRRRLYVARDQFKAAQIPVASSH
jgi:hypothetical protein